VKVETWNVADVKPYPGNPRLNDSAVEAVAKSIREFGFRQPIVVDANHVVVAGHTRLKAAIKLGLTVVPVHLAVDLTPEQIKAYRLADNKLAELAVWDYELLPIELASLKEADYDLGLLGFSQDELLEAMGDSLTDGQCDPDDIPAPPDEATTKPGDLWILGNHRLLCGDSSKPRMWIGCWMVRRFTWSTQTRRTTSRSNRGATTPLLRDSLHSKLPTTSRWIWLATPRRPSRLRRSSVLKTVRSRTTS
jgi:ParB-like chromosome segregation protein Spo0J